MAITARKKDFGHSAGFAGYLNETLSEIWRVDTDSGSQTHRDIIAAAVLPGFLTAHASNPILSVRNYNFDQRLSPTAWEVRVEYSSEPLTQEEIDQQNYPNPVDRPPRIEWVTNDFVKPIYEDVNGHAILNSAGDYPDPPVEVDASRFEISIVADLAAIPSWVLTHRNVINSASITVQGLAIPALAAKTRGLRISDLKVEGSYSYYTVSFGLELATEQEINWRIRMLDQGMHELNADNVKVPIQLDGEDAKQPVLLDGTGKAITNPQPSDAVFLPYDGYVLRDLTVLPGVS